MTSIGFEAEILASSFASILSDYATGSAYFSNTSSGLATTSATFDKVDGAGATGFCAIASVLG